jgi:hypothetical protein
LEEAIKKANKAKTRLKRGLAMDRPGIFSFLAALLLLSIVLEIMSPGTIGAFLDYLSKNVQAFFVIVIISIILYWLFRRR